MPKVILNCNESSLNNPRRQSYISNELSDYGYRGEDPFFLEYGKEKEIFIRKGQKEVIFPCLSYRRGFEAKIAKRAVQDGKVCCIKFQFIFLIINFKMWILIQEIYQELFKPQAIYDPTEGFTLNLTGLARPWGKYICFSTLSKTFDRVIYFLREKFGNRISARY